MSKNSKKIISKFKSSMKEVSKELKTPEHIITLAQYLAVASELEDGLTEAQLRLNGGFTNLRDIHFRHLAEEKDIATEHTSKYLKRYRNRLEKQYGEHIFLAEETGKEIVDLLKKHHTKLHKPVRVSKSKKKKTRTIVAHLSDLHYGVNIHAGEVANVNEFNYTIASRRTALFCKQVADYKPMYRTETDLVLVLNGDIIAGVIHDQEHGVDLGTTQHVAALKILSQAITYLAQNFQSVKVVCTVGNHGRYMHKANKGRQTSQKWDAHETNIYTSLKLWLQDKYKNIQFVIPESPFAIMDIQGHKMLATHGDGIINPGNPGKAINMKSVQDQVNKLNATFADHKDERFKVVMVGHVHTPTVQLMDNGCIFMVNGCLSGTDPYAQSISIFGSNPTQQIFEVTKEHAVGDIRLVQVKDADEDKSLDKIIEPFSGNFLD